MKPAAIREKLYDYIRVADDKKVQAIFVMLEDDITEQVEWWNDNVFVSDLEKEYKAWDTGREKGYSLAEVEASIDLLRKKRRTK